MLILAWSEILEFFSDQVQFGPRLWNLSGRVRDFNFPSIQLCARLCVLCTFWVGPIKWIGNTAKLKIIHNLTFNAFFIYLVTSLVDKSIWILHSLELIGEDKTSLEFSNCDQDNVRLQFTNWLRINKLSFQKSKGIKQPKFRQMLRTIWSCIQNFWSGLHEGPFPRLNWIWRPCIPT